MSVAAMPMPATASNTRNNIFSFFTIWRSTGNQPNNRPINITKTRFRGERRGPKRLPAAAKLGLRPGAWSSR
jgi:hypothetical protein